MQAKANKCYFITQNKKLTNIQQKCKLAICSNLYSSQDSAAFC